MQTEALGQQRFDAIHVMDREADIFDLVAHASEARMRFVVRAAQDRVVLSEADELGHLFEVVRRAPSMTTRIIELSERPAGINPKQHKRHPQRRARSARVAIAGARVALRRPKATNTATDHVLINVVRVWELDPPAGEPGVEWILLTTEPIDTSEQLDQVVDWYRARWTIEEFFKALKTGCAIEKRQLESYESLTAIVAIFAPIAWRRLLLRSLSRACPTAPASAVTNDIQRRVLAARVPGLDANNMNVEQALFAIARLGGHLKRNGPPGWLTIARGYEDLLLMEVGWRAALAAQKKPPRSDQS